MRIIDNTTEAALANVGLGLTAGEATELRDSLDALLASPVGRHEHVPSADYRNELTVWILDDDRS